MSVFYIVQLQMPCYNIRKQLLLFSLSCFRLFVTLSMDCSMLAFPFLHYVPEFAQTLVHWVDDAIQPSHPLLPTSPPVLNLSQQQGLFQWVSSSHQVAKVLDFKLKHQSFQRKVDFLSDWLVWFPCFPRESQESSPTLSLSLWVQKSIIHICVFFPVLHTGSSLPSS